MRSDGFIESLGLSPVAETKESARVLAEQAVGKAVVVLRLPGGLPGGLASAPLVLEPFFLARLRLARQGVESRSWAVFQ